MRYPACEVRYQWRGRHGGRWRRATVNFSLKRRALGFKKEGDGDPFMRNIHIRPLTYADNYLKLVDALQRYHHAINSHGQLTHADAHAEQLLKELGEQP